MALFLLCQPCRPCQWSQGTGWGRPENQPASQLGSAWLRGGHRRGHGGLRYGTNALGVPWAQCLFPTPLRWVPTSGCPSGTLTTSGGGQFHLWLITRKGFLFTLCWDSRVVPRLLSLLAPKPEPHSPIIPAPGRASSCLFLPLLSPKSIHPAWARASLEKNNVASSLPACNLRQRLSSPTSAALTPLLPQLRGLSTPSHSRGYHASHLCGCPCTSSARPAFLHPSRPSCDVIPSLNPSGLVALLRFCSSQPLRQSGGESVAVNVS